MVDSSVTFQPFSMFSLLIAQSTTNRFQEIHDSKPSKFNKRRMTPAMSNKSTNVSIAFTIVFFNVFLPSKVTFLHHVFMTTVPSEKPRNRATSKGER